MEIPNCYRCGKELSDLQANLMVDYNAWMKPRSEVLWLRPYCIACTKFVDQHEDGKTRFHHIWNLNDVMRSPLVYLGEVLRDLSAQDDRATKWTPEAVANMVDLVIMALEDEQAIDLLKGAVDWNLESARAIAMEDRILQDPLVERKKKLDALMHGDEQGAKFADALVPNEIQLLRSKLEDLYYFTRGLLVHVDFKDPANKKFYPSWLAAIDKGITQLHLYKRGQPDGEDKGNVIKSR